MRSGASFIRSQWCQVTCAVANMAGRCAEPRERYGQGSRRYGVEIAAKLEAVPARDQSTRQDDSTAVVAPLPPTFAPSTALVFVVPAFNEEANVPRLLADLESRLDVLPDRSHLIVVDDGSEDATASIVESYGGPLSVQLVRLGANRGPGAAFRAGFDAALDGCSEDALIVTLEADTT